MELHGYHQYTLYNCDAQLVTLTKKCDHITALFIELHWLPVEHRTIFNLLLITFKGLAPHYLKDLKEPSVPHPTLTQFKLVEPPYKLTTYGPWAFSVFAPRLYLSIPLEIRQCDTIAVFKNKAMTYLNLF